MYTQRLKDGGCNSHLHIQAIMRDDAGWLIRGKKWTSDFEARILAHIKASIKWSRC